MMDYAREIERFLAVNGLFLGRFDRLWSELEAHRIDQREPGDGTPMPVARQKAVWEWLQRQDEAALRHWERS